MSNLLVIEASPRGPHSVSRKLAQEFRRKWQHAKNGTVLVRDLSVMDVPYISLPWIEGAFTPQEQHSDELKNALSISDNFVAELMTCDEILIATPMCNFGIPGVLKSWIDQILRVGVTFSASYQGLVTGKKATIIITSGGDFSPGTPFENMNTASTYLRQALGFIGITNVNIILAGRTLKIDQGNTTTEQYIAQYESLLNSATN